MARKWLGFALASVMTVGAFTGCAGPKTAITPSPSPGVASPGGAQAGLQGKVTASGSSALLPLVNLARQKFMESNPNVDISATAGGSGVGIKNVADGVSDIGNSDVEADEPYKSQLKDHIVCIAPFALIVSKDVTVDSVTKRQAADIFMGKITNWKQVGGQDAKINLVHRPESSGSRKLVKKIILQDKDFSKEGVTQDSSKTVAQAVAGGKGAIGYVDAPYITPDVKALKLDGVDYTKENIRKGTYPLYGTEHMYTKGEPTGAVKAFIDFMVSKEFIESADAAKLGFLPADLIKK
jgi:phosphate transport system substrate-binding protein